MIDQLFILLKIFIINFSVAFNASFIGLYSDIRNHNSAVKGGDTDNETAVVSMKYIMGKIYYP